MSAIAEIHRKTAANSQYSRDSFPVIETTCAACEVSVESMLKSTAGVLYGSYISVVLTAPVVSYFGRNFFVNAWKKARLGKGNMDTLVATGFLYPANRFLLDPMIAGAAMALSSVSVVGNILRSRTAKI